MRHSRAELNERLKPYGLHVAYYNPGDNPTYKIVPTGVGYFETTDCPRYKTLAECAAHIDGRFQPWGPFPAEEVQ